MKTQFLLHLVGRVAALFLTMTVTVVNSRALDLTCPANITTNIMGGSVVVAYPNPTTTNGTLVGCTPASGSTFSLGTTLVSCMATNAFGSNACAFNVIVNGPPSPCPRTNKGTNFWLAFPANCAPDPTNHPGLSLSIVGVPGSSGQVTIPGLAFESGFIIPASMVSIVNLPWQVELAELSDAVTNKGIHITSQSEVGVYALNHGPFTSDGYLALPTAAVGTEYIVLAHGNVPADPAKPNGAQFAIVGTEDGTSVTILPSVTIGGHAGGFPYQISLNEGATYQLRNETNAMDDFTGTIISADKPVAVFTGQRCARIPNSNTSNTLSCNTIVEQLLPTAAWGTNFLALPLATRMGGDTFRFIAAQPGTTVQINGAVVATLEGGDFIEQIISGSAWITSDKPILVAQYANSFEFDGVTNSAAFMAQVPPTTLFLDEYTVFVMTNGTSHYLNLVIPDSLAGFVWLDGTPIPAAQFSSIPDGGPPSGFSGAQVTVAPGLHTLAQTSPEVLSFGAMVYGFGPSNSYGYPAGMQLGDVQPPTITSPAELTLTMDTALCAALVPAIEAVAHDNCTPDHLLLVTQNPPAGTPASPGLHEITLTAKDLAGFTRTSVTRLTVLDPLAPTLTCPGNIEVFAINGLNYQVAAFTATASSSCNPDLNVECEPPSGAAFPVGTTVVTCMVPGISTNVQCTFTVTVRPLVLSASRENGTNVVLRWEGPATLEMTAEITGAWQAIPNAASPFVFSLGQSGMEPQGFFRLRGERGGLSQSTCDYSNRYREILIGDDQIDVQKDIYYARPNAVDGSQPAPCWQCSTAAARDANKFHCRWYEHTYDLYQPISAIDNCPNRAMVVMVHGGAFLAGSKEDMRSFATIFAKAGYVVAVINYRRADSGDNVVQQVTANILVCSGFQPWLALQDLHAALNHITANSINYRVDPNKIFLFGTSAGAVTVLHGVYADDDELRSWSPAAYSFLGGRKALDRYPDAVKIAGIATFSGAIFQCDFYDVSNSVPNLMVHGTADLTVPFCVDSPCGPKFGPKFGSGWLINHIMADSPKPPYKFYERVGFKHFALGADHIPYFHAIGRFFFDIMDGVVPTSECVSHIGDPTPVCPNVFSSVLQDCPLNCPP